MINIVSNKYSLHGCAYSNIGGRPENQDSMYVQETPLGLLVVVSDGMGGGPGGKTASTIVVTEIVNVVMGYAESASSEEALKVAIGRAQEALEAKVHDVPALSGMGATAVVALVNAQSAVIASIGDSRCYRIGKGKTLFRTDDHSLVAELVRRKVLTEEQARTSPQSNVITKALGTTNDHVPNIYEVCYRKGDRFVLCTDGVWGSMTDKELVMRLSANMEISQLANGLADEVDKIGYQKGGYHDNHTLAILEMDVNSIKKDKMSKTIKMLLAAMFGLLAISVIVNIVCFAKLSKPNLMAEVNDQNRKIEILQGYKQRYEEIVNNVDSKLTDVVNDYAQKTDSLTKIINLREAVIDSLKKKLAEAAASAEAKPNSKPAAVSSSKSKDGSAVRTEDLYKTNVNKELGNVVKELEKMLSVAKPNSKDAVKELKGYIQNALAYINKVEQANVVEAGKLDDLKRFVNADKFAPVWQDKKDKKYKPTAKAIENIGNAMDKAKALKKK